MSVMHNEHPAVSDSTAIIRSDLKLKWAFIVKFVGVVPTSSMSVIIEAGALHAHLGT